MDQPSEELLTLCEEDDGLVLRFQKTEIDVYLTKQQCRCLRDTLNARFPPEPEHTA